MDCEVNMQKIVDYLATELTGVQIGRANKWLVEHIKVDTSYGYMPIGQIANISVVDAQTLKIEPRDKSSLPPTEKAIYDAATWLAPQNQWWYLLIKIPVLTTERREQLKKQVSKMAEECKARIRVARQDELKEVKKLFEEKIISEDEKKNKESDIDAITKKFNDSIDAMVKGKHDDITTI